MVHVFVNHDNDNSDDEEHDGQLCCRITCPVCQDPILGRRSDNYFILSNFHKHVKIHLKSAAEESSNKKARKQHSKQRSSSAPTRRSTRKKTGKGTDDNGSESDDNEVTLNDSVDASTGNA